MSILNLKILKGKPIKSRGIMPLNYFLKYAFGTKKLKNKQKLQLIRIYENLVKF